MAPSRKVLCIACAAFILSAGCQAASKPVSRTEYELFGTACTITLYDGIPAAVLDQTFSRLREIEARLTVNRASSQIVSVNEASGLRAVKVSTDTMDVLQAGLEFSRLGDGAFDITIGPLVRLWGIGTDRARVPGPAEISAALGLVGFRNVQLDAASGEAFLRAPGMRLDLGAIAKGYAADEASRVLQSRGVKRALINLGGNILTLGRKPDGSPWRIGIQNPEDPRGAYLGILSTNGTSVVTSGVYERFFEQDGRRYHHLLDTKTGYPVSNGLASVSIVTARSIRADGFSTLLFALGLREGLALAKRTPGLDAIFVDEKRDVYVTTGIRGSFSITDNRFRIREETP